MLGIRISLEDVTATSGLLPVGVPTPPSIAITQPDAQVPPPPPKVPSILPSKPESVSYSPQLSLSPTNTHGSPVDASFIDPTTFQEVLPRAQMPQPPISSQTQQSLHEDSPVNVSFDDGLDSHLRRSTESPDLDTVPASALNSPILDLDLDIAPRPGLPITPHGRTVLEVQLPQPNSSHRTVPPQPQPSIHTTSDHISSNSAAGSQSQPLRTSQDSVCPAGDKNELRDAPSDGVSSPVHYLAAAAHPSPPLPTSPLPDSEQAAETDRPASVSPSILGATLSGTKSFSTVTYSHASGSVWQTVIVSLGCIAILHLTIYYNYVNFFSQNFACIHTTDQDMMLCCM